MTVSEDQKIVSDWDDSILFSAEHPTLRHCLQDAVRRGVTLHGANLGHANLQGANLRGADLHGAKLHHTNLRGADLRSANLAGADLHGAQLAGAKMFGAVQICGHRAWLSTTLEGNLRIGCQVFSFSDWDSHADAIGRAHGYTPFEVEIYRLHAEHIKAVWEMKEKIQRR